MPSCRRVRRDGRHRPGGSGESRGRVSRPGLNLNLPNLKLELELASVTVLSANHGQRASHGDLS
jgi:hypothetical protein